jgi:hypothetical protein
MVLLRTDDRLLAVALAEFFGDLLVRQLVSRHEASVSASLCDC